MKISYVRVVSALFALAALTVAGRAQTVDQVTVKIPYEFVAAGKTLPAGTYRVNRVGTNNATELELVSFENHTGVLLISNEVTPATDNKPTVSFELVGDQHYLSKIETSEHVFAIPVPAKSAPVVAKNQSTPSPSSSSGSN